MDALVEAGKFDVPKSLIDNDVQDVYKRQVVTDVDDLNAIADIVPPEKVEAGADIHAANVDNVDNAQEQIDQVLENMNPGDVAVFLCSGPVSYTHLDVYKRQPQRLAAGQAGAVPDPAQAAGRSGEILCAHRHRTLMPPVIADQ